MIVSVLFLIGLFLCVSAYLILTGLNFIGLSYLLVYVGAVLNCMNKYAGWVRISLYKVLLIINDCLTIKNYLNINDCLNIRDSLFNIIVYKNKLPFLFKFKREVSLAFAAQNGLHSSQKSHYSNLSEEFIK